MAQQPSKHLRISGIVQGVNYRATFQAEARRLKLSGWVRNRLDGSVEALISGQPDVLDQMIRWAWQGPSGARVREMAIIDSNEAIESGLAFQIVPTQ
ncbi:acylphosphatase [Paraherbaspirillum soli]|uniref:acylphosphatase n=1 Tax=Paraherbaspirillum soli TaxID=631222 RepID=A0ABW0MBU5_9BURK